MRVLIADDNRLMLEGVRRALQPVEDIEIVGATHTGSQILPLVESYRPDLVALELGMRGADGRRCVELLREQHPGIKVVVFSARSTRDDIHWAYTNGARAFIVKTVDPLDIPAALRRAYHGKVQTVIGLEPAPADQLRAAGLSERELTMLKALARGLSNKAISRELLLSEETVKSHLGNLYRKLGVPNRLSAANTAHTHGITAA